MFLAIAINTTSSANEPPKVVFKKKGSIVGSQSYGHLHFKLDLNLLDPVYKRMDNLKLTGDLFSHFAAMKNEYKLLKRNFIPEEATNNSTRLVKRGALSFFGGALGVGSILFGIYQQVQISNIKAQVAAVKEAQTEIIHVMKKQEDEIRLLDNDVRILHSEVGQLAREQEKERQHSRIYAFLQKISRVQGRYSSISNSLFNQKGHSDIQFFFDLEGAAKDLRMEMIHRGFQPLFHSVAEVLQCPASFITNPDYTVEVFLHVPMSKGVVMKMMEYIPTPFPLPSGNFLHITPKQDILAISEGQEYFKILDSRDLLTCSKMGQNYLCPGNNVLNKFHLLHEECLGALFAKNLPNIMSKCEHKIEKPKDIAVQLDTNDFFVHSTTFQHFEKKCHVKDRLGRWTLSREFVNVQGSRVIHLEDSCSLETTSHLLVPESNINLDGEFYHIPFTTDDVNSLHLESESFRKIEENLKNIRVTSDKEHQDNIARLDRLEDSLGDFDNGYGPLVIALLVAFLSIIVNIVVTWLMMKKHLANNDNKKPKSKQDMDFVEKYPVDNNVNAYSMSELKKSNV